MHSDCLSGSPRRHVGAPNPLCGSGNREKERVEEGKKKDGGVRAEENKAARVSQNLDLVGDKRRSEWLARWCTVMLAREAHAPYVPF
jgi:hypothetical protein